MPLRLENPPAETIRSALELSHARPLSITRGAAHYSSVPLSNKPTLHWQILSRFAKTSRWQPPGKNTTRRRQTRPHSIKTALFLTPLSLCGCLPYYLCAGRPARCNCTRYSGLHAARPTRYQSVPVQILGGRGRPSVVLSSSMTLSSSPRLLEDYHPKLPAPPRLDRPPIFVLSVQRRQNRQPAQN